MSLAKKNGGTSIPEAACVTVSLQRTEKGGARNKTEEADGVDTGGP